MSTLPNLLRSLLLASLFSFAVPVGLIGMVWGGMALVGHIPQLTALSQASMDQIEHFLQVFGSGSAVNGLLVIGLVCSLVGALFDTYTFYRYQNFRNH